MTAQCLIDQTVVQLNLHASSGNPINFTSKQAADYIVRISASSHVASAENSQEPVSHNVQLKVLSGVDCFTLCGENHSRIYKENDFFTYLTSTTDLSSLVFKIDVYSSVHDTNTIIGHGFISASQTKGSAGSLDVTLFNDSLAFIGHITVSYFVIRPWIHPLNISDCDEPRRSRAINGMKSDGQYYFSGHRGAGVSFKGERPSIYPENTISAFRAASELGVDFVEMDVQVSKDMVPVVFHDGTVQINLQSESLPLTLEVPVKDLTIEQLQNCKVAGIKDHKAYLLAKEHGLKDIELDYKLCPSLKEVFDNVPEQTGLILEVKYPLALMDGESIDNECMDQNEFVDAILQVVYENAKDRKIILCSFDPDICCMLQLKQAKFSVYIITQDANTVWTPYIDQRTRHIHSAIAFSKAYRLDGIHSYSEELINSPENIDKVLAAGFMLSVWGSPNEDHETRQWLHNRGVLCIQVDDVFQATRSTSQEFLQCRDAA